MAWTSLIKSGLAQVTSGCPICRQQRPTLGPHVAPFPAGSCWPSGGRLMTLDFSHHGQDRDASSQEETPVVDTDVPSLPVMLPPSPTSWARRMYSPPTWRSRRCSLWPGNSFHSKKGQQRTPAQGISRSHRIPHHPEADGLFVR